MHFPFCFTSRGGVDHHMPDYMWGPFGRGRGGPFGRGRGGPFGRGRGPFGRGFGPLGRECGPLGDCRECCGHMKHFAHHCGSFERDNPRENLPSRNPPENVEIEEQIRKVVREFFNERGGRCCRGQHDAAGRVGRGSFHPWHFGGHFHGRHGWAGWSFGPCEFQGRNTDERGQDAAGKATEGDSPPAPSCGWHYRPDLAHHECQCRGRRTGCLRSGRCTEEDSAEENEKQDGTNCCCQRRRHIRRPRQGSRMHRSGGNVAHDSNQEVSDAEANASAVEENLESRQMETENSPEKNVASGSKPTSTEQ